MAGWHERGELCRPCSTLATLHWLHHSRPTLTLGPSSAWAPSQHLTLTKHFSPMNGDYHHIYHGSRVTGQRQQISWVWCYHRLHICLAKCHKGVCTNPASSYKGWKVKLTLHCEAPDYNLWTLEPTANQFFSTVYRKIFWIIISPNTSLWSLFVKGCRIKIQYWWLRSPIAM